MTIDLSKLPTPAEKNISVRVKAAAERAVRQGHPWVFEDAIVKQSHLGNAGDLAVIYDREKNQFLAVGLYDPLSPMRIKILQALQPLRINRDWFIKKISEAQAKTDPANQRWHHRLSLGLRRERRLSSAGHRSLRRYAGHETLQHSLDSTSECLDRGNAGVPHF